MKLEPIVNSLIDTDLYKFTMEQLFVYKHMDLNGEYDFKCRNKDVIFTEEMVKEINDQIDHLCTLSFKKDELKYLKSIRFLKPGFIEFLSFWKPKREYVKVNLSDEGELSINIAGPIFAISPFEIYVLEIVNEVYFRMQYDYEELVKSGTKKLDQKILDLNNGKYSFKFAEFGCRRRLSREWEDEVVRRLATETDNMVGTSNVYLAKKYNLKPIGTYAHEMVQCYQGIPSIPLAYTNRYALQDWYDLYRGDLGTALTDTITTDAFLLDFDRSMANNFTGVRHDSGNAFDWGDKILAHYKKYGIDPKTKTLLFSDGLNFTRAQDIYQYFKDKTNVSFGIGTYISNDTDAQPLNIVVKLQSVNGNPVAKLSDCEGKIMCRDDKYVEYLKNAVKFRIERENEK